MAPDLRPRMCLADGNETLMSTQFFIVAVLTVAGTLYIALARFVGASAFIEHLRDIEEFSEQPSRSHASSDVTR